jgi:two-component system chemotaxis response regulator CheY
LAEARKDDREGFILVAEDDADTRGAIREALESAGYAAVEARNGREALRVVFASATHDVRLIVTDLNMPEISGSELMTILAGYTRLAQIPIVVVTGTGRRPGPRASAAAWLEKPFDMDALLGLVALHVA